jgi:hypothetical protein
MVVACREHSRHVPRIVHSESPQGDPEFLAGFSALRRLRDEWTTRKVQRFCEGCLTAHRQAREVIGFCSLQKYYRHESPSRCAFQMFANLSLSSSVSYRGTHDTFWKLQLDFRSRFLEPPGSNVAGTTKAYWGTRSLVPATPNW